VTSKPFAVLGIGLLLCGCTSYGDYTSDAFDPGAANQTRFLSDAAECQNQADIERSYTIPGIAGTHASRHELFNAAFAACMQHEGYALRGSTLEAPIPYDVNPWPG
jgi:hypothetical protein